jgi:hypothetical protein
VFRQVRNKDLELENSRAYCKDRKIYRFALCSYIGLAQKYFTKKVRTNSAKKRVKDIEPS